MRRSVSVPFYFIQFLLFILAVVALRQATAKDIVSAVSDKILIKGKGVSHEDCAVIPAAFNRVVQNFPPSLKLIHLFLNTNASKIWCAASMDSLSPRIGATKQDLFFNPWSISTRAIALQLQQFNQALMNLSQSSELGFLKALDKGDQRIREFKKLVIKKKRNKLSLEENILFVKYVNAGVGSLSYEAADFLPEKEYSKIKSWPKFGSFLFSDLRIYYQLQALAQGGAVLKSYARDPYASVLLTTELWKGEGGSRLASTLAHLDLSAIQVFYPEVLVLLELKRLLVLEERSLFL